MRVGAARLELNYLRVDIVAGADDEFLNCAVVDRDRELELRAFQRARKKYVITHGLLKEIVAGN